MAGLFHYYLIGRYILYIRRVDGSSHLIVLQDTLLEFLVYITVFIRSRIWLQNDDVPIHFSTELRKYLDAVYTKRWQGLPAPVQFKLLSLHLSFL